MAVLPEQHRRGIGRALVERAAAYARAEGLTLLHVKTLAPSDPDPGYAATRRFYEAVGFMPLEELPQVWGPENPCLRARAAALTGRRAAAAPQPRAGRRRRRQAPAAASGAGSLYTRVASSLSSWYSPAGCSPAIRNFCTMSWALSSSSTCSAMNHCRKL